MPEIDRQQAEGQRVAFRTAAFARPAIYEALETRGVGYAIRIPANKNLELAIEDILFRLPGRPSLSLVANRSSGTRASTIRRTAGPWPDGWWRSRASRGRAVPARRLHRDELTLPNRAVVRFYNKPGTAEQWIKEGKQAAHWT